MKQHYKVIGKISEVDIDNLSKVSEVKNRIRDKEKLRIVVTATLAFAILVVSQDTTLAASTTGYKEPSQLKALLEFIDWLVDLLRIIVSSVAGLICTFAGYKWATAIESNGQETAKKILKNAFVGGLIVWTGTSIADFFVGKMNDILL